MATTIQALPEPQPVPAPLRRFTIEVDEELLVELAAWSWGNERGSASRGSGHADYRQGSSIHTAVMSNQGQIPSDIRARVAKKVDMKRRMAGSSSTPGTRWAAF